jgi:hypothetical protein
VGVNERKENKNSKLNAMSFVQIVSRIICAISKINKLWSLLSKERQYKSFLVICSRVYIVFACNDFTPRTEDGFALCSSEARLLILSL